MALADFSRSRRKVLHPGYSGKKPVSPPVPAGPRDSGVQSDANRVRTPPKTTTAFGPVRRADAPITQAQQRATRQTTRARRKINRRVSAPALPKLAHPTSAQRTGAYQLVLRSAKRQGLTLADLKTAAPTQRKRFNRGLGYQATLIRNNDIRVALAERVRAAQHVPLPSGYRYGDGTFGAGGIEKQVRNPYTGELEWMPVETFVGPGTEDRVLAAGARQQKQDAGSLQRQFNTDVERIVSKVRDPQQRTAALERLVEQYTPAPGRREKHPRMALAAEGAALGRARASEGKPYEGTHIKVAGLDLDITDLVHGGRDLVNKATVGLNDIPAAILKDALTFPVAAAQAGVAIARAGRDALGPLGFLTPLAPLIAADYALRPDAGVGGGNFDQAAALADAFTRGPTGELVVHGDPDAALQSLKEHPLFAAADVAGAYGLVGRVAGAAGRAGMTAGLTRGSRLGRAAHALGDTTRAPARLYPGAPESFSRSYSKNALTKALQVRGERRMEREFGVSDVIPQKGPIADRLSGRTKAMRGQVHEFASTEGEGVRRHGQQEVAHQLVELVGKSAAARVVRGVGRAGVGMATAVLRRAREHDTGPVVDEAFRLEGKKLGRAARDTLAAMVEQRIELRPGMKPEELKASILREYERLADAAETGRHSWSAAERRLNRLQRRALWRAAHDERLLASADRLSAVRDRIVDMATTIEEGLIRAGVLDRRQALIAKVRPLAIARLGHSPMSSQRRAELERERGTRIRVHVKARRELEEARIALERLQRGKGEKKPERVAAAQARVDAAERAVAETHAVLGDEVGFAGRAAAVEAADRRVRAAQKRVERAEAKRQKAIGGEAVRRGQKQAAERGHPGKARKGETIEPAETTKLRDELAQLRRDEAPAEAIAAKKAELDRALEKARSAARRKAERELTRAKAARDTAKQERKAARKALAEGEQLKDFSMGLQDRHGNPVTTDDVVAAMEREGIPMPAYVRHGRGREAESFFRNWFRPGRRSSLAAGRRSGVAVERGGYASDWHALAESLMRRRGDLDSIQTWDRFIHEFGVTKPDGDLFRPDEVEAFLQQHGFIDLEGNLMPNMPELVAVWAYPRSASRELMADLQRPRALDDSLGDRRLADARDTLNNLLGARTGTVERAMERDVIGPADKLRELLAEQRDRKERRIVLMPAEQLRAFRDHQQTGTTTAGKVGQVMTNLFRGTVLPFSTKWLTGNVVEAFIRLAVAGARLDDLWRGHKVLRELKKVDEEAYELLKTRALGGLFYGSAERLRVYSGAERFEHTSLEGVARTLESLGTPRALINSMSPQELMAHTAAFVPRQMFAGLAHVGHGVFRLNKWFEREAQTVALGRYARERGQEFSKSWFKATLMQKTALEQVVKGLTGTPEQIRFARYVDETLGKYARFSPTTRRIIQTIAPFLPWYLNSVRFIMHTLPVKHPVLTNLIVRTEAVMAEDFEKLKGEVPPGDLEAALPLGGDRYLTLARYTPFGAFTSGLDVITDPILPQIVTSFGILKYGVNFTGRELDIGDPEHKGRAIPGGKRALLALNSQLEALLPFLQIARRLQEHGETAYDDSWLFGIHTKPDTATGGNDLADAFNRVFNPFRPVELRPQNEASGAAAALKSLPPEERRAIEREARQSVQQSTASDAEQRAIEDEARRILAAQGAG